MLKQQQPGNQKPNLFLLSIFFQNLKTLYGKFQCEQPHVSLKSWHLPGREKSHILASSFSKRKEVGGTQMVCLPPTAIPEASWGYRERI